MTLRPENSGFRPLFGATPACDARSRALKSKFWVNPPREIRERAPLCALLCALAGCRFEVTPDSFDLSADVGQDVSESIEVRNTGDEPVAFSLASEGARITLSKTSGVLQSGAGANIGISAGRVRSRQRAAHRDLRTRPDRQPVGHRQGSVRAALPRRRRHAPGLPRTVPGTADP